MYVIVNVLAQLDNCSKSDNLQPAAEMAGNIYLKV